jgi:transposase
LDRYKSSENRNQINMLPLCLDDMIPEEAEVRAIDAIIEKMDISSMGFTHSETKETGRKPYNPVDMFRLYAYGYYCQRRTENVLLE